MAQRSTLRRVGRTLVGLLLFGGCVGLAYILYRNRPASPEPEPLAPKTVAVEARCLEAADVPVEVRVTGTVGPYRRGRLTAQIAGRVVWIAPEVEQLATCPPDGALVRLDETDASIAEKRAQAALDRASARLAQVEVRLAEAKAQADLAADALALARSELERTLALARDELVSPLDVERKKLQENQQRSTTEMRRRERESAAAERDVAAADVALAHQDLEAARKRLRDCTVSAPFSALITRQGVEIGDWVLPGQTLAELVQIERLRVRLYVPAEEIAWVDANDPVAITVRALGDLHATGRVEAIAADGDLRTRTFEVVALVENTDPPRILPGMFAAATIRSEVLHETITVPRQAVCTNAERNTTSREEAGSSFVYIIETDSMIAHARDISIRRWLGETAVVAAGLDAGEWVATEGIEWLYDGARVKITPQPPAAGSTPPRPATQPQPGG